MQAPVHFRVTSGGKVRLCADSLGLRRRVETIGSDFAVFARQVRPEISALEEQLGEAEARLGTERERADDMELCRSLAHRLAGLFCASAMIRAIGFDPSRRSSGKLPLAV